MLTVHLAEVANEKRVLAVSLALLHVDVEQGRAEVVDERTRVDHGRSVSGVDDGRRGGKVCGLLHLACRCDRTRDIGGRGRGQDLVLLLLVRVSAVLVVREPRRRGGVARESELAEGRTREGRAAKGHESVDHLIAVERLRDGDGDGGHFGDGRVLC